MLGAGQTRTDLKLPDRLSILERFDAGPSAFLKPVLKAF